MYEGSEEETRNPAALWAAGFLVLVTHNENTSLYSLVLQ